MLRFLTVLSILASSALAERPAVWAQPLEHEVKNLHRISAVLYRSAQPDSAGLQGLKSLGVKTVINLRHFGTDATVAQGTDLRLESVKMDAWHIDDDAIIRTLALLRRIENGPFLIHCQHGADRTGVVCAMYRIIEQGWSREDAIRELTDGGYGFHKTWTNIPRYLAKVDVEKIRRAVDAAGK